MKPIETVSILGMGALGLLYASQIAEGIGSEHIRFVMDPARFARHKNDRCSVNGKPIGFAIVNAKEASPCDLLIVAVKYPQLEQALDTMASSIGPDTIILSVMNGISSEEILGDRYGRDRIIHTVALGMDAMHFGTELIYTKAGRLCVGICDPSMQEKLDSLTRFFDRAHVPYSVEEDIIRRMWSKFMINVGINQTCMAYGTTYAGAMAPGSAEHMTLIGAMREVILIANAEGVALTEADLMQNVEIMKTLDPGATPSMGQDRINRRRSEVELFAGTMIRLGRKHGIPVPTNEFLYRRVREIESEY